MLIMREIKEMPGISIGGHKINLRYADDTVLISNSEENLQELMNIVNTQSIKKGLSELRQDRNNDDFQKE